MVINAIAPRKPRLLTQVNDVCKSSYRLNCLAAIIKMTTKLLMSISLSLEKMGLLLGWVIGCYSVIFPRMIYSAILKCHSRYFLLIGFREITHQMTEGNFAHFSWHFTMGLVVGVVSSH